MPQKTYAAVSSLVGVLRPWILAARPKTLPAAISPVLVGSAIAFTCGRFRFLPALAAVFTAVMIQVGTNYFNDVIDYLKGTDAGVRLGPTRVTQAGLLTSRQVWFGGIASFVAAALAGIYLAAYRGWEVLIIGVACFLAGILYSVGPYSLVNTGLADLFVLIFFGLVAVGGTVYVLCGSLPVSAWLGGVACGVLVTAILVVNNIRDASSDRLAGRKNIPALWGKRAGEIEFFTLVSIAYLVPVLLWIFGQVGWPVLVVYLSLPTAITLCHDLVHTPVSPAFNLILARTARLVLFFSLLLSFSFIASKLI